MKHLNILADDLTGAADSAARCRWAGLPATIFLKIPESPLPAGVRAFTSDSRHLPAAEAAQRVRMMAAPLQALDAHWYKKIDSTLRGHIGSELDVLLELLDAPAALICPAFPAQKRGLHTGHLVAPDLSPIPMHLPSLLQSQSRYPVAAISLEDVRNGKLAARLQQTTSREGHRVLVVDALTDEDLDTIVDECAAALPNALLCGSAGLVGALARRLVGQEDFPVDRIHGPRLWQTALLLVGSGSQAAHRQIAYLQQSDLPVSRLTVTPHTAPAAITHDLTQPIWLVHQPPPAPDARLDGADARQRIEHMAQIGAELFARRPADLLLLGGGDTAVATLSRLHVERLSVEQELLPGMPLCQAEIDGCSVLTVLKPGSFGEDGTLVELLTAVACDL